MAQDTMGDRSETPAHRGEPPASTSTVGSVLQAVSLAAAAGLLSGFAAIALRWLIPTWHHLLFMGSAAASVSAIVPLLPAIGGLLAGTLVDALAVEARGAGVSQVLMARSLHGSRIRPRVAGVKLLATSLVLGSGGSAGMVGPMVQIGAALGSAVGQRSGMPEERLRVLLAAGAAAGIAAAVNAPMAGLLFALEVILLELHPLALAMMALAVTTGAETARLVLGDAPLLGAHHYSLETPAQLGPFLLLGGAAGSAAVVFSHGLHRVQNLFSRPSIPVQLRLAMGGLAVGAIGLAFPQVHGLGFETMQASLEGRFPLALLVALLVAKMAASWMTVGSGASGGVVGPSLYLGAALGGAFGILLGALFPDIGMASGAYALAGMAALFGSAFHAPLTAIAFGVELTGDYQMLLPLAVATTAGRIVAGRISPHTIYSIGSTRQGIDLRR